MTDTRQQDPRVDELRQRLRSLGYLDAGVDRFVLAPAQGHRSPAALAMLSSLRVGVLGAVLLGPATAIGVAGRLSGLVTGTRDAIVIAVYMGVLLGAAIAVATFGASLGVAWLARRTGAGVAARGRTVALAAGTFVAIATLAYLTLWWQTANAALGLSAPVWTGFALAVAAAISVLLGHAVTLTALAVTAAGSGPLPATHGVPGASWRVSVAATAVAFCGAVALLVLTAPAESGPAETAPLAVLSSGVRVRVVAIDGFDPAVFTELERDNRVPVLSAALSGARATLRPEQAATGATADPARTWTTVATGQPADLHGVKGLETRRVAGVQGSVPVATPSPLARSIRTATDLLRLTRPAIASGTERTAKTFWEVAAGAGLRTAVINWWASWPAPDGAGVVLSDRASLRLERGGELAAEIAPAELYASLRQQWPDIRSTATAAATRAIAHAGGAHDEIALLQRSAELDALQLALAGHVTSPNLDLLVTYLPGLDIVQHTLLGADPRGGSTASSLAARLDALKAYYQALDHLLEAALSVGPREALIVVTGPGRVTAGASGLMVLSGEIAARGAVIEGGQTDVAPTLLHALGIPISAELRGTPLTGLFAADFTTRYPVRTVGTYGRPPSAAPRDGQALDQEMIDRLRSLGYVR